MVSLVQPVQRPCIYQQPLPVGAPQYVTAPPLSVTVGDADYFQYSDLIVDGFQYNQNQVLLDNTVDNSNYAMEYHQQHSYQQVQQVQQRPFLQVQNIHYQRFQQSGQQQVVSDQPRQQIILDQTENQSGSGSVTVYTYGTEKTLVAFN